MCNFDKIHLYISKENQYYKYQIQQHKINIKTYIFCIFNIKTLKIFFRYFFNQ